MKNKKLQHYNKYFYDQNTPSSCGAVCLKMLIKFHTDIEMSTIKLSNLVKERRTGTTFLDLKKGTEKFGFQTDVFQINTNNNFNLEDYYPFILQRKENNISHFIVVFGQKGNKFIIGDPLKNAISLEDSTSLLSQSLPYIFKINYDESAINQNLLNEYSVIHFSFSSILKRKWKKISLIFLMNTFLIIVGIILSRMYPLLFDVIIPMESIQLITTMFWIFFITVIIHMLLSVFNNYIGISLDKNIDEYLTENIISELFSKDLTHLHLINEGEILDRIINVQDIKAKIEQIYLNIPITILTLLLVFIILSYENIYLTLLILLPVYLLFLTFYLSNKKIIKITDDVITETESFHGSVVQNIKILDTIKSYKSESFFHNELNNKYESYLNLNVRLAKLEVLVQSIRRLILMLFNIFLFSLGGYLIIQESMTTGTLLMFSSLLMYVTNPFQEIVSLQFIINRGKIAEEKYNNIVNINNHENITSDKRTISDHISFENLTFGFDYHNDLFKDAKITLNRRENIAIVGPNGIGKSTLGQIISGNITNTHFNLYIDNTKIDEELKYDLRNNILYINQSDSIMSDTFINNLKFGNESFDNDYFSYVSMGLGINNLIDSLPLGLDQEIGKKNIDLSFGQAQLLNITRALLKNKDLYVWDEITNGLDSSIREKTITFLISQSNNIFLTHDDDLIEKCDIVYEVNNNKILKIR